MKTDGHAEFARLSLFYLLPSPAMDAVAARPG